MYMNVKFKSVDLQLLAEKFTSRLVARSPLKNDNYDNDDEEDGRYDVTDVRLTDDAKVQALLLLLQRIHSELNFITARTESENKENSAACDWKFAAMVVDRFCLYVFTIFIFASTLGIFLSAPHLTMTLLPNFRVDYFVR
uniref:Neurotransmitter-gated ion-channel transmembrane domain-containing protein n=1 Tax=Romanomermis culicivorax TaxID=13658 RepID=A0A915IPE3_ROMCU